MSPSARLVSSRRRTALIAAGALAMLVTSLVIGTPAATASTTVYRLWTLSGVTFDDGGTLSGTMIIADDGTPYSFDVTTSGGNTGVFGTNHYTGTPSPFQGDGPNNGWYLWAPNQVGQLYLNLRLPDTTTANQGDSLSLPTPGKSWECTQCDIIRYISAGSIMAGGTVDLDPPEISYSVDPDSPDGAHGWYIGDPTVTWTVTDPDSEITNETGCDDTTLDEDTEEVQITCEATSGGGTASNWVFLRRDATPPTLAPNVVPKRVLLNGPINVAPDADDATSGVASQRCSAATDRAGLVSATCHATDVAGNSTKAKVSYTVEYVLGSIARNGGNAVGTKLHLTIQVKDAKGNRIPDREAAGLGCRLKVGLSGAQTHHACLTYDKSSRNFGAAWTLGKQAGPAQLRVSVTYPNSSVKTAATKTFTINKS